MTTGSRLQKLLQRLETGIAPTYERDAAMDRRSRPGRPGLRRGCCAVAAAVLFPVTVCAADAYPSRPVTLIVPFAAGGSTDSVARALGQGLGRQLGQPVIIDNKSGAGGTVGATQVMRSAPDGYTLLMGGPSDQVNAPFMMAKAPYEPARDFAPVGCAMRSANVLVVNPGLPAQSTPDLIRLAKAQPGKINFASAGNGNTSHLLGEMLAQSAGVSLTHVPYRGNAPALTDLLGGQVQMMFAAPVSVLQYVKSGTLRAIGVTSGSRLPDFPKVPTLRESGIPIEIYSWACLFVPAKTPAPIVEKLHSALTHVLDDPSVLQLISAMGSEKFAMTPAEAQRFLATERSTWSALIRSRNIHAD